MTDAIGLRRGPVFVGGAFAGVGAGRARVNSSSTIWREPSPWDWAVAEEVNESAQFATKTALKVHAARTISLKIRVMIYSEP